MFEVYILVGMPASGKTTFRKKLIQSGYPCRVISRDDIRTSIAEGRNTKYVYTNANEKLVSDSADAALRSAIKYGYNIIVDNTHCRQKYLNELINKFDKTGYKIYVKFFDVPLWKAYYRNVKRYLLTGFGIWIPWKVMKDMYRNYNKIDKTKYAKYTN